MTRAKSSQTVAKTISTAAPAPKVTRKRAALGDVSNHVPAPSIGVKGVNGKTALASKSTLPLRQKQVNAASRVETQSHVTQETRRPLAPISTIPILNKQDSLVEEPPTKLRRVQAPVPKPEIRSQSVEKARSKTPPPVVVEAVQDWDDLDMHDMDDPLMVSEYVVEIFNYLREQELQTLPTPDYMDRQKDLQWKMRGILIDWLVEVHLKFRLLPETLFLAVNIIDRFLSLRVCSLPKLQLVGITALFIASKYEEVMCPSIQNFVYMADGGYKDEEILKAEQYVCHSS